MQPECQQMGIDPGLEEEKYERPSLQYADIAYNAKRLLGP
jgi:hypothetical protein